MPTPRVRRLDKNNDASWGKGSANYAEETESTEQRLLCYLRGIGGEYFLDTSRFLPWFQAESSDVKPIMGAAGPRDLGYAEALIKAAILGLDGIASLQSFDLAFDANTRHLSISAVVLDDDGNPIVLQQFDPLGVG
jgi:hypothetical protein